MTDRIATVEHIITVEDHPDADRLELVNVLGYQCVARKGEFSAYQPVVYIPEQTIVPEYLLRRIGLWDDEKGKGKLAGSNGDRVKAVKLRGKTSLGLLVPFDKYDLLENGNSSIHIKDTYEGMDVSDFLGITKWEPPIPISMSGQVFNASGKTPSFDVDNIRNFPQVLYSKEFLNTDHIVTEKLHGTWACFGFSRDHISDEAPYGFGIVSSKGLSAKGLAFKDVPENENNVYLKEFKTLFPDTLAFDVAFQRMSLILPQAKRIYLLGEIFGKGIQDLTYGNSKPSFRLFDVLYVTDENAGEYHHVSLHDLIMILGSMTGRPEDACSNIRMVPILHHGILTPEKIFELTDGKSVLDDGTIREGIVIRPAKSFMGWRGNIYKSISDDYLNRKNATEFN